MSELIYKEKYLKYKNKYLELKNKTDNDLMVGGNYYAKGIFVFFLTQNQANPTSDTGKVISNKKISDINTFTNQLGTCALFLRIGSTTTGFDFNHTYDSIYPNKSATAVVGKSISDASNKAAEISKDAYNVTSIAANKAMELSKNAYNVTSTAANKVMEASKAAYNKYKQTGGDNCDNIVPMRLSEIGLKSIKYVSDINANTISSIVNSINAKSLPEHKIVSVVVINKFGNVTNDAEILNRYDITYENNNPIVKSYQY